MFGNNGSKDVLSPDTGEADLQDIGELGVAEGHVR